MSAQLITSSAADLRIARAAEWLSQRAPGEEVLVVGATADAAGELLRGVGSQVGASFGWHRATLGRVAALLALPSMVEDGFAPVGALAVEALAVRVLHGLEIAGALGRYARAARGPGLARAVAGVLGELRLALIAPAALDAVAPELRRLAEEFEAQLRQARLADRAEVLKRAAASAADRNCRHPLLSLPTLLLDVAVANAAERRLVEVLAARAPEVLATAAAADRIACENLGAALGARAERLDGGGAATSLASLQSHLFEESRPPPVSPDERVVVLSAPGESRECVEIARRLVDFAGAGIPFDRMAILLRSPEEYRPHLEEALGRAQVPAYFARGAVRPHPAGRAFCALLNCAAEGLSARRFAEYLSLGEVPDADDDGAPPPPAADRWVPPDEDLVPQLLAGALAKASEAVDDEHFAVGPEARAVSTAEAPSLASDEGFATAPEAQPVSGAEASSLAGDEGLTTDPKAQPASGAEAPSLAGEEGFATDPEERPVSAGTLRAPRRWERILVDAGVIGGRERWVGRLDGWEHELRAALAALDDDPDGAAGGRLRRNLDDLDSLRSYALPLLEQLSALPRGATWGVWLTALVALAAHSLRHPERVLAALAELAPMAPVGPVSLEEVRLVLARRLLELSLPAPASRHGRVFVAPVEAARGLAFDVVFVPGLAERLFPRKICEEPILLDAARRELAAGLPTNDERVARERLMLRLAVGAARERVVLTYPRLDLDQSRPRVPSFYALEALRAAEGHLPSFDELAGRAERIAQARVGWPAPREPEEAIDAAEHDLALLERLRDLDREKSVGAARYLLTANPHLGRALRFRARRWLPGWTVADGLVKPSTRGCEAIRAHTLDARSYSPTALEKYATCPYQFFLYAVHKLAPSEVAEAIEEISPLQRGSLVHEVQFLLLGRLRDAGLLPVARDNLVRARALLDEVLDGVAERARDDLAPAIERVWEDGIESVRADLREWLRRASAGESQYVPWRFELAFGLPDRRARDAHSVGEAADLDCGIHLRGSIDLVERRPDGALRATDHKTGRARAPAGAVVAGGASLQPLLYALALEKLFPAASVVGGRLYYCTAAGGFEERSVALDERARGIARRVVEIVGRALSTPFLPAAPARRACQWCDYRVVCGPYEELRTGRKRRAGLEELEELRGLP